MISLVERITKCMETREKVAGIVAGALSEGNGKTELEVHDAIVQTIADQSDLQPSGWYAPPPEGVAVLFGNAASLRSKFKTLREQSYWSNEDYSLEDETVGMVYVSPVHKPSGAIGDFGMSFYRGKDESVRTHIKNCLETVELATDFAQVGLPFKDLNAKIRELLSKNNLNNDWTTTFHDPLGTNFGHTIPWSYENPTTEEQAALKQLPMDELKDVISRKRLYLNEVEEFEIPETIAFTLEVQCTSTTNPELPNAFFHTIVTFREGEKKIITNFNNIFDTLNIEYMRSKF